MAATIAASCSLMRASFPFRPPNRPQGSLASSLASLSSALVPEARVPSRFLFSEGVSGSSSESSLEFDDESFCDIRTPRSFVAKQPVASMV
jgi:hypothetical protein